MKSLALRDVIDLLPDAEGNVSSEAAFRQAVQRYLHLPLAECLRHFPVSAHEFIIDIHRIRKRG